MFRPRNGCFCCGVSRWLCEPGPQFSREYSRLLWSPATSGCGADPVAASASRIVGGYTACSNHESGDDSMTLRMRGQLAATIETWPPIISAGIGLRTDPVRRHGVPLPTQGNED